MEATQRRTGKGLYTGTGGTDGDSNDIAEAEIAVRAGQKQHPGHERW